MPGVRCTRGTKHPDDGSPARPCLAQRPRRASPLDESDGLARGQLQRPRPVGLAARGDTLRAVGAYRAALDAAPAHAAALNNLALLAGDPVAPLAEASLAVVLIELLAS